MSEKEIIDQTSYCETDSIDSDKTDEEKESKIINRVKEWYNQKLQAIITDSADIDLEINDILEISIEDQYSARYITTDDFGILLKFDKEGEFYMVKRVQLPPHNEGTGHPTTPYAPHYNVTKFKEYTTHDKLVLGKQRYIISPQVYCQCTYSERKWFQDPYISWAVEDSGIALKHTVHSCARAFELEDGYYSDHYSIFLHVRELYNLHPTKFRALLREKNFVNSYYKVEE